MLSDPSTLFHNGMLPQPSTNVGILGPGNATIPGWQTPISLQEEHQRGNFVINEFPQPPRTGGRDDTTSKVGKTGRGGRYMCQQCRTAKNGIEVRPPCLDC